VAAIMSACSRTPWPRSRSKPVRRKNGHAPTRTEPIRQTIPWRTAEASIRSRTARSSIGLSNIAARLATSAAAIAPASHLRPRVPNDIAAGCHTRRAGRLAGVRPQCYQRKVQGKPRRRGGFELGQVTLRISKLLLHQTSRCPLQSPQPPICHQICHREVGASSYVLKTFLLLPRSVSCRRSSLVCP
jgi:hypothetical protein